MSTQKRELFAIGGTVRTRAFVDLFVGSEFTVVVKEPYLIVKLGAVGGSKLYVERDVCPALFDALLPLVDEDTDAAQAAS